MFFFVYSQEGNVSINKDIYFDLEMVDEFLAVVKGTKKICTKEFIYYIYGDSNNKNDYDYINNINDNIDQNLLIVKYNYVTKSLQIVRKICSNYVLYYGNYKENIFVSTSLMKFKNFFSSVNELYFQLYLYTGLTQTELTPYKEIYRLLPGYMLTIDKKNMKLDLSWNISTEKKELNIDYCKEKFLYLLQQNINNIITQKKKVGCEISGGLDSSTIAYILNKKCDSDVELHGFSYIINNSDKSTNLANVMRVYETTRFKPHLINLSNYWAFKNVPENLVLYEEPDCMVLNNSMFYELNKQVAEENIDILFSGEGADNVIPCTDFYIGDLLKKGKIIKAFTESFKLAKDSGQTIIKVFLAHIMPTLLSERLSEKVTSKMDTRTWHNIGATNFYSIPTWIGENFKKPSFKELSHSRTMINQKNINSFAQMYDLHGVLLFNPCIWLQQHYGDIMEINRAYPFRAQTIVEYLFSLPIMNKKELGYYKNVLRTSNIIPLELRNKPDCTSFSSLYQNGFEKEWNKVSDLIENSVSAKLGWIDKDKFRTAVFKYKCGYNDEFPKIMRTFALEIWLRFNKY